jgi:hypothetical protein
MTVHIITRRSILQIAWSPRHSNLLQQQQQQHLQFTYLSFDAVNMTQMTFGWCMSQSTIVPMRSREPVIGSTRLTGSQEQPGKISYSKARATRRRK